MKITVMAGYADVIVRTRTINIGGLSHYLPPEALEFIDRFDSGLPVDPFTFEVAQ